MNELVLSLNKQKAVVVVAVVVDVVVVVVDLRKTNLCKYLASKVFVDLDNLIPATKTETATAVINSNPVLPSR